MILAFLLISSYAVAAPELATKCNFESLTDNCRTFAPDADLKIPIGPGTFLPNYAAVNAAAEAEKEEQVRLGSELQKEISAKNIRAQFKIAEVLNQVPSSKMSPGFKFSFANSIPLIQQLIGKDRNSDPEMKFAMFWPPNDLSGRVQEVDKATAKAGLEKILSARQLREIRRALGTLDEVQGSVSGWINRTGNPLAAEINNVSPQRRAEVEALEKAARESVVRALVGSKPETQWSAAEAAAVGKIRNIKLNHGNEPGTMASPTCQGVVANAFYNPVNHSINICQNFYNLPDASLVLVLGHELGHAIDPCRCQHPVYNLSHEKMDSLLGPDKMLKPEIQKDPDLASVAIMLLNLRAAKETKTAFNFAKDLRDPAKLEFFIKSGILTAAGPVNPPVRQENNELHGYILSDVYRCLASAEGGGFRQVSDEEINSVADSVVAQRLAIADDTYDPKADRERITSAFRRFPQCDSPNAGSQMGEAVSDWLGTQALADHIATRRPTNRLEQLAGVGPLASNICLQRSLLQNTNTPMTTGSVIRDTKASMDSVGGEHPASKSRIERIMLNDPRVAEAMGCEKPKYPNCRHEPDRVNNSGGAPRTTQ